MTTDDDRRAERSEPGEDRGTRDPEQGESRRVGDSDPGDRRRTGETEPSDGDDRDTPGRSTESDAYRISLDRDACDGVFACLVRDDRFVEAADGLATIGAVETTGSHSTVDATPQQVDRVETFEDDRLDDARQAAAACPVDAISVEVIDDG